MKIIIATVCLVAITIAEPPPSNSYLPPSPSSRGAGYPSGPAGQDFGAAPQIVAARTLDNQEHGAHGAHGVGTHGAQGNGFGRSSPQGHGSPQSRFSPDEPAGYDHNAAAFARNSLEENNAEPANYNFGYMVNDYQEGTDFGHHEERQEERAQGEYHVVLPDGRKQTVSYEADERGFKPQISYEDTEDFARSGYDSNAANLRSSNHGNGYSNHGNGYSNHGNQGYSGNGNLGSSPNARSNGYN